MPIDKATALAQIDAVFERRKELDGNWIHENVQEITTLACAVIKRLAPPGSAYLDQMESVFQNTLESISRSREEEIEFRLKGILRALRADYEADRLQTFQNSFTPTCSPTSLRWPSTSCKKDSKTRQQSSQVAFLKSTCGSFVASMALRFQRSPSSTR